MATLFTRGSSTGETLARAEFALASLETQAYEIPTDSPESDGTFEWNKTTLVVVEVSAGNERGLGYTYADKATAHFIREHFRDLLLGRDAMDIPAAYRAMRRKVRNVGRHGVAAMALSAVDTALWDLKAKLLRVPLAKLFGLARERVPLYGSGGFTSYTTREVERQLARWIESGLTMVKIKIGRHPEDDPDRVRAARRAIGRKAELFVDANGAYEPAQALSMAERFAEHDVRWFEEPVSSDDLDGLRVVRLRAPAGMAVAAGEYGYDEFYFQRMLERGAVDVLQLDATRCGGYTGFLAAAAVAHAHHVPVSAHCAPALHLPVCAAVPGVRHIEFFHDHARVESILLDGLPRPQDGALAPDPSRPGHGLSLKRKEAERRRAD
jgi:L-alanine-DL-glutamate epimerase-like enolase superfamily enzyme